MNELKPVQAVLLIAGRELTTKLRTKAFVIGTVVTIVVLAAFVLLQASTFGSGGRSKVGLSGQATALGPQIVEAAQQFSHTVEIHDVADAAAGEKQVRDGDLDALVTGPVGSLQVTVKRGLDSELRNTLNGLMRQQILTSELAAQDVSNPKEILTTAAEAQVKVSRLEPRSDDQGQRLAIGLVVAFLLYMALMIYGQMVAQGVVEEKSNRVVEILLATVRPWQLLAGKVLGLGLVGLIQFALIAVVGLIAAVASGTITLTGAAIGGVLAGLFWYLLGFFFYATIFAAVGSLVSRQEEAQSVLTPVTMVIVVGFIFGINLLIDGSESVTRIMAVLPPFAPILMPGLTAMGLAPIWLQALAIGLTLGGIVLVAWLGGTIYRNAVLRTGARVRLAEAFKSA